MMHAKPWLAAGAATLMVAIAACSAVDLSSLGDNTVGRDAPDGGFAGSTDAVPNASLPTDNAIIVVHAAKTGAFRLCFESQPLVQPAPDATLMPSANVVGVEIGSAVRVDPLPVPDPGDAGDGVDAGDGGALDLRTPGRVTLYDEAAIRPYYTGTTPLNFTCGQLATAAHNSSVALGIEVGTITTDLTSGVHLLIVEGCQRTTDGFPNTTEECGDDFVPETGNLRVREQTLTGANRYDGQLPTSVVNLSPDLERFRAGRPASITYGSLDGGSVNDVRAADPDLDGGISGFGTPPSLDLDAGVAIYAQLGFSVNVDGAGIIAAQSLADIQNLSSPRVLPGIYYATAQNYVLLLLGTPVVLDDGGAYDSGIVDVRQELHFLAVPVVNPKVDAGADAGDDDGGSDAATTH